MPLLRLLLSFSLVLWWILPAKGQDRLDTLKERYHSASSDSIRYKALGDLSWEYLNRDQLDSAAMYADTIRLLAERDELPERIAYAEFYYGVIDRRRGNHAEALGHLDQFIRYYAAAGDSTRMAYGLFQKSGVYINLGDYEEGLAILYRILHIYEYDSSNFDIGYTLNSIGVLYKNQQKYDDAIRTYQQALDLYDRIHAPEDKANVLGNLANVYVAMGRYDDAKNCFACSLRIDKSLGSDRWVAFDLENIGNMYNQLEKYDSGLIYMLRSVALRQTLPFKNELGSTLQQTGNTYVLLGRYEEAEEYLDRALQLARETGAKPILQNIYASYAGLYKGRRMFERALEYHQLYTAMKDSLLNAENTRQLNELQTKYETAEKDKRITLLAREKEIQQAEAERQAGLKKIFITGLVLVCLLSLLLIYVFRQRLRHQRILAAKDQEVKAANFQRQVSELEIKALRAQINPHFLFNCMNSINRMILEGETDNASLYLTKFSRLVRMILENTEHSRVSLENELAMLESYIQLESLRFKGRIHYTIDMDDNIEPESTYLPSMVLQPFVENAIWHGLMHKDTPGHITISLREEDDRLHCRIEDNGVGREKARALKERSILKQHSMGMKITEERLRLLSKDRLEELIRISDLRDAMNQSLGTRVDITVPIT